MDNNNFKFTKKKFLEMLGSLVIAVALALVIRTLIFELYLIPSGSMKPNFKDDDYLFVKKFSYGYSIFSLPIGSQHIKGRLFFNEPKRGDIIIFTSNKDFKTKYIKRLIGLPGDEVQVKDGILYINGQQVKQKYIGQYYENGIYGEQLIYNVYEEQLPNGVTYKIMAEDNDKSYLPNTTPIYKVPKDHYFFMGDNRDNSKDSRFLNDIGYIPQDNLVGRAGFLYWSRDFSLWKFLTEFQTGRLFKNLQ